MTAWFRRELPENQPALLPQMRQLISRLEHSSANQLKQLHGAECPGILSYRAETETRPSVRFDIVEADAALLLLLGQPSTPFEVLQVVCAGFQYHWRSDLAKILADRRPLIGRMSVLTDRLDVLIEHLAIPVAVNGGPTEIRGWFAFSHRVSGEEADFDWNDIEIVRRHQCSRRISLPRRVLMPSCSERLPPGS